jgi:AcrR family transcriptional regulator
MTVSIKQRIIEQARDRFFSSGFSKVTMDELATELGISKKTMYQYFPSKDELIDQVITWQVTETAGVINGILNSSDDFIKKLYAMWVAIGRMASRISKNVLDDMRRHRPDLWKRIGEMRQKVLLENITRMIDEGIERGLVRVDVNKQVVILMYLSSVQGVVNPDVLMEQSFSSEEALKTILRVYLDGILTEKARVQFHKQISE